MNVGMTGSNFLQTTAPAQTAQGLQTAVSPVSQAETLTRINATQNTPNNENKPNNNQHAETDKNADEIANKYRKLGENVNEYKPKDEHKHEEKQGANGGEKDLKAENNPQGLSEDELKEVKEMSRRDREVRTHEQAHMAAAGQYARGGINIDTKTGPDGKSYAVSGHVSIDTSPVPNNPQATIQKANKIRAAAMAPAEPSSQDRAVASEATKMATEARSQIVKQQLSESKESIKTKNSDSTNGAREIHAMESENKASSEYRKVAGFDNNSTDPSQLFHQLA